MNTYPIYSAHLAADGTYYVLDPNGHLLSTYATADEAIEALRSLYDTTTLRSLDNG